MKTPNIDIRQEVDRRAKLLKEFNSSTKLQAIQIEFCKRDIHYFFDNYLYTDKNKTIY
jgi:hypothetical protein